MTKAVGHTAAAFVIFADFPIWAATTYVQKSLALSMAVRYQFHAEPRQARPKRGLLEGCWKCFTSILKPQWIFFLGGFFFLLSRVVSYRWYNDDLGILVWALPSWDAWGHVKLHGFEWHVKPPTEVHEPNGVARDDIYILDKGAMFFWQTDRG